MYQVNIFYLCCPRFVCMFNIYILNGNSPKLSMLAYCHMKNSISLHNYGHFIFEEIIAFFRLTYFIKKLNVHELLLKFNWNLLKTTCLHITIWRFIYHYETLIRRISIHFRIMLQFLLPNECWEMSR
jgi:hypothetical protein